MRVPSGSACQARQSGFGRELGPQGLATYQQIKHIHVGQASTPAEKYYTQMLLDDA